MSFRYPICPPSRRGTCCATAFFIRSGCCPTATREGVTAEAAAKFANIAVRLRQHYDERRVAHFINKLVFCLFAEDIELLPDRIFADILDESVKRPDDFEPMLRDLFRAMANRNGRFGTAAIPWFNGGLFDDDDVLPLGIFAVRDLTTAARLDWRAIDPTIFGTLFEGGLDDKKRAEMASLFDAPDPEDHTQPQLFNAPAADRGVGIHYTDEATIMKIIEPVVVAPLRREWERIKAEIREAEERRARARTPAEKGRLLAKARGLYARFPDKPRPLSRPRPGLRLGQFSRPVASRAEGFRSGGGGRCRGDRACRATSSGSVRKR